MTDAAPLQPPAPQSAFALEAPAALVLAPTHLLQLLPDPDARAECLRCVAASLQPGGLFAVAWWYGIRTGIRIDREAAQREREQAAWDAAHPEDQSN